MPKKDEQFVTEWKLWAPTAMEVSLELFSRGSSREHGDRKIASIAMTRGEKGVWSCALQERGMERIIRITFCTQMAFLIRSIRTAWLPVLIRSGVW